MINIFAKAVYQELITKGEMNFATEWKGTEDGGWNEEEFRWPLEK